jgi:pyruvate dehydrogenase E2 component (dihydrolipoamide acetyltransferase)/2-oxoisovalerate dehydrogenase E2 component (dihydrolipoyl transacylase)
MDFALPEIGEGVYEAELINWLVKPGQSVKRGQGLVEVMTDKATMEVPSPFIGTIEELRGEPGQKIKVGDVLLTYAAAGAPVAAGVAGKSGMTAEPVATGPAGALRNGNGTAGAHLPVKAAPSVRYMARKLGIDLSEVSGSGPQGRILLDDLTAQITAAAPGNQRRALLNYGKAGTRLKLQGVRRRVADRMALAKRSIPHYSYIDECDVTELARVRYALRETCSASGVKLTYLPFFVKAAVAALRDVPMLNATYEESTGELVMHDRYHIGIAVATPSGLIVPVIHDADKKDIPAIARELERLSRDARSGRSKLDDLKGSTFTVSSVGNLGGLFSTPVINYPEVGILGVGKIARRPMYDNMGQIKPTDLIYLSFSFDHRVIDGAIGAHFANVLIRKLQNPVALLLPDKI